MADIQVDLTNCDREPIRIPGAIQPHGFLLALDASSLIISHASGNLANLFGSTPTEVLGRPLAELVSEGDFAQIQAGLANLSDDATPTYLQTMKVRGRTEGYDAIAHRAGDRVVVEFEPTRDAAGASVADLYRKTQGAVTRLRKSPSLAEAYRICVAGIREIAGFDRVMIYRFDDEWNGVVIAEERREDLESFLGLHYPASDIPRQARELYAENWLRFIADRRYVPVPILPPAGPDSGAPLDLSRSVLRSVSPIHLEYLGNMGVGGSMSISLLKGDRLWGLVACHHYTPRYVPYDIRTACELLGQVVSMQLVAREEEELGRYGEKMDAIRGALADRLERMEDVGLALTEMSPSVQDLVSATGSAVLLGDSVARIGLTPGLEEILEISAWLAGRDRSRVYSTDNLKNEMGLESMGAVAAGLLSISIGRTGKDRIIWFRPEQVREVNWAGDPAKSLEKGEGGVRLSPRGSFALWKQVVRDRSRPWSPAEMAAAADFRRDLMEIMIGRAGDVVKRNLVLLRGDAEKEEMLAGERAARSEAERLNRMKDEFVATLSHELRTPLNAIMGWTQILRRTVEDEDVKEASEVIERNARVQANMIEELLDMSRIASGKLRLEMQPVGLTSVVDASVDTVAPAAQTKGIRIERLYDASGDVEITGDPNRLQQVFWNLLSNAVKFTPKGGKVQVLVERVNSHVEISVSDTGQGIIPEFLPHIFDRFRQQDASTNRQHGGLGLGLSIVRHLVELHGGTVFARSEGEGRGSDFVVTLPIRAVSRSGRRTGEHPTQSRGLGDDGSMDLGGVRILVVDDEGDARLMMRRILEDCGATVTTGASADEALEIFMAKGSDVIVSDIGMPGRDGYEFMKSVRKYEVSAGLSRCPAVALTAYARPEDRRRSLLAGFQSHVAKPVEAAEITAVIASLVDKI